MSRHADTERFCTPDTSCMTDVDKDNVYDPEEDTFLILDGLEKDIRLIDQIRPSLVVEVGCGSGVVSVFTYRMLRGSAYVICTDINQEATRVSNTVAKKNNAVISPVVSDLCSAFGDRLNGKVDLLIFNPPYLVTEPSEVGSRDLKAAWAGGDRGRQVLDRLLPCVSTLLSPFGLFYMTAIKENDVGDIENILRKQGLSMCVVLHRLAGSEALQLLRFQKVPVIDDRL